MRRLVIQGFPKLGTLVLQGCFRHWQEWIQIRTLLSKWRDEGIKTSVDVVVDVWYVSVLVWCCWL